MGAPGIGIVSANSEAAARLDVDGLVVLRVLSGSAAEHAGLKGVDAATRSLGDVIVAANGANVQSMDDFRDALDRVGVGGVLELSVKRAGVQRTLRLKVEDRRSPA